MESESPPTRLSWDLCSDTKELFDSHGSTLIPAWIRNYIDYKMLDENVYPVQSLTLKPFMIWKLTFCHTLLDICLPIHAGIKAKHVSKMGMPLR